MLMKHFASFLFFPLAAFAQQQQPPFGAWKYVQSVSVTKAGLNRFDLPLATLNSAQSDLQDLRLTDSQGKQVPIVIEGPLAAATRQPVVENFRVILQDGRTVLNMDTGTEKPISTLMLQSAARDFVKAVTIEGSNDGSHWTTLLTNEMIFRQPSGAGRTSLEFNAPAPWAKLRATILDDASAPVPFTGALIEWREASTIRVPLALKVTRREEVGNKTLITLDVGVINLRLAEITLHVTDPLFIRDIEVQPRGQAVTRAKIHRLSVNNHKTENLTIPVFTQLQSREITVAVFNQDSRPLKVESVSATRDPVGIAFHATAAEPLRLYSGHMLAPKPQYDLGSLADQLRHANASSANIGELQPNPQYQGDPLDSVLAGANIDVKPWSYRRAISLKRAGVAVIDLDPFTLSHSHDQNDIRIVQNGVQVPYRRAGTEQHVLKCEINSVPNPKRPNLSNWRITLPHKNLPADSLTLSSPTTLFERTVRISGEPSDVQSVYSLRHLGSHSWLHAIGQQPDLDVRLPTGWRGDAILIETDNGDNAPIELGSASVTIASTRLVFSAATTEDLYLYYGNANARFPRYDASLIENLMFGSQLSEGNLGPEETLSSGSVPNTPAEATSPWLWVALSVVVIGLIAVMAKLLPKTETPA
jgi:hypothetical protein